MINVHLPPLRERGNDISLIANHFLADLNQESDTDKQMSAELTEALLQHDWPGNIRELQNEIRRVHALGGDQLSSADLSPRVIEKDHTSHPNSTNNLGLDRGAQLRLPQGRHRATGSGVDLGGSRSLQRSPRPGV